MMAPCVVLPSRRFTMGLLLAIVLFLSLSSSTTDAFTTNVQKGKYNKAHLTTSYKHVVALHGQRQSQQQQRQRRDATATHNNNNNRPRLLRRDFFKAIRRVFFGSLGTAAVLADRSKSTPMSAFAAEIARESGGTIVQLQIANLNSDDGSSSSNSVGTVRIRLRPEWAPRGVARFEELVSNGFYDNCRFFRVLPGFIAQFGINGDPSVMSQWRSSSIPDDPVKVSNTRGTVVFATAGPNTRTTQIFINTRDQGNAFLDRQGFSPFGEVIDDDDMKIIESLYAGYGEGSPSGRGPNQGLIQAKGNEYLTSQFPKLSYITKATLVKE